MSNNVVPDSDLAIGGGGGGGGGASPPKIFSGLRASIWSKNMGGPGLPGPSPGFAYYQ